MLPEQAKLSGKLNSKHILTVIAFLMVIFARYLPRILPFSQGASQVIYQFVAVLSLWLFVAIDWPSLLLLFGFSLVPELKFTGVLQAAFGNQTFAFLLFTFSLTYVLTKVGLLRQVALAFITSKFARLGGWHFVLAYFASILVLGCFISPTVLFFIYLAILTEICTLVKLEKDSSAANLLMLGTVFFCSISSGMTTISHVFPLISLSLAKRMLNLTISHVTFSLVAIPIGLVSSLIALAIFYFVLRPDLTKLQASNLQQIKSHLVTESAEPKSTYVRLISLIVAALVLLAWLVPTVLLKLNLPNAITNFLKYWQTAGISLPPLLGFMCLCLVKTENKPLVTVQEALTKGVSWPSLIMCASTLALGAVLTNKELAFNTSLANLFKDNLPSLPHLLVVLIFCAWAGIQTNFSSNMVTATLVTSTLLSLAGNLVFVNIPLLVCLIGILASYAFAAPSAMPCVAIAAASGFSNSRDLLRYGLLLIFLVVCFISFIAYPLLLAVV